MWIFSIEPCFGIGHNLSLICQMTSEDMKHQLLIIISKHCVLSATSRITNWKSHWGILWLLWCPVFTGKIDNFKKEKKKSIRCICLHVRFCHNNNNNEYLERLARTGPKRLHVLYKYILSKFNAYNMNAHTHARTHTDSHTHARAHKHTHTHTHKHTHTHTHTLTHTHTRTHTHAHARTRTHTYTYLGQYSLSSYKTTLKQQLNGENDEIWDGELRHLSVLGWAMFRAMLFSCPVLGRSKGLIKVSHKHNKDQTRLR